MQQTAGLRKRKRRAADQYSTIRQMFERLAKSAKRPSNRIEQSEKHVVFSLTFDGARIDILSIKTSSAPLTKSHYLTESNQEPGTWSTTVSYTPNTTTDSKKQIILRYEHQLDFVSASIGPTILTYRNVRSNSSKVFKIAQTGFVDDLRRLLDSGEASTTDCDEQGRSLLGVSYAEPLFGSTSIIDNPIARSCTCQCRHGRFPPVPWG